MEEEVEQDQDDSRNAHDPREEIFAHDGAPFGLRLRFAMSTVP
jgi:hypothetical protein